MVITDIPCSNAPSSWDWRNNGAVTDVKDQGKCSKYKFYVVSINFFGLFRITSFFVELVSYQFLVVSRHDQSDMDSSCMISKV